MYDNFQLEIKSVSRRVENLKERAETLTKHEYWARKKSELLLREFEELEGILRPIWWLRSLVFDRYSLIVPLRVQRCERKLVRYEFELAVLMDIEELTKPVWPPGDR